MGRFTSSIREPVLWYAQSRSHQARACFQSSQPEHNGRQREHAPVIDAAFLVAGGDAPELLQAVDQPFGYIALAIGRLVETPPPPLVGAARNDHPDPALAQILPDVRATIALIPDHALGAEAGASVAGPLDRPALH